MIEPWSELVTVLPDAGFKLAVAIICGFMLGFERERKDKPAGLRTIMLITAGSTLFMIVSDLIPFISDWPELITRVDPSRVASQVVTGIGFLGAGSIIQARGAVHGLTTAAVIWVGAGIGLCIGIGYPFLGIILTVAVVTMLIALDPLRQWLSRASDRRILTLIAPNDSLSVRRIELALKQHNVQRDEIDVKRRSDEEVFVRVPYYASSPDASFRLLDVLSRIEGVRGQPEFE